MRLISTLTICVVVMHSLDGVAPAPVPAYIKWLKRGVVASLLAAGAQQGFEFMKTDAAYPLTRAAVGALEDGASFTANGWQSVTSMLHDYGESDTIQHATDELRRLVASETLGALTRLEYIANIKRDRYMPAQYQESFIDLVDQLAYGHSKYFNPVISLQDAVKAYTETHPDATKDQMREDLNIERDRIIKEMSGKYSRDLLNAELLKNYEHKLYPLLYTIERNEDYAIRDFMQSAKYIIEGAVTERVL